MIGSYRLVAVCSRWMRFVAGCWIAALVISCNAAADDDKKDTADSKKISSPIKKDESVILFPTCATRLESGSWRVPVHGWIFELEPDSKWRRGTLAALASVLELDEIDEGSDSAEERIFRRRAQYFLADNERKKEIPLRAADRDFRSTPSKKGGHFDATIDLDLPNEPETTPGGAQDRWLDVEAITHPQDARVFKGRVQLLEASGLSVISDLDDTIKHSDVTKKRELLRNTFLREFRAVDGMSEFYARLAKRGAAFHYVSSSPWQLYPELAAFLVREKFPEGSFFLQSLRLKDRTFWSLFRSPEARKIARLTSIITAYPQRRYILIGDSAERDPEVYGAIARKFGDRVEAIYIRDVSNEDLKSERMKSAFEGVAAEKCVLFDDPAALGR